MYVFSFESFTEVGFDNCRRQVETEDQGGKTVCEWIIWLFVVFHVSLKVIVIVV